MWDGILSIRVFEKMTAVGTTQVCAQLHASSGRREEGLLVAATTKAYIAPIHFCVVSVEIRCGGATGGGDNGDGREIKLWRVFNNMRSTIWSPPLFYTNFIPHTPVSSKFGLAFFEKRFTTFGKKKRRVSNPVPLAIRFGLWTAGETWTRLVFYFGKFFCVGSGKQPFSRMLLFLACAFM